MLAGGDRRSIGKAESVTAIVARSPRRFAELWACLGDPDSLVRMRAADAAEKVTRAAPELLADVKGELLDGALDDGTREVRWHLIAMTPRLPLTLAEAKALLA